VSLPNVLTLFRVLLIPTFVLVFLYHHETTALVVFTVAAVTDFLDGWLARRTNQQTGLGAFLDPMADKLLMLTAFAMLFASGAVPLWALVVVASREVVIVTGWVIRHLLTRSKVVTPSLLGKATTAAQLVAVTLLLAARRWPLPGDAAARALDVAMAFTAVSGLHYLASGLRELEPGRRPH